MDWPSLMPRAAVIAMAHAASVLLFLLHGDGVHAREL